MRKKSVVLLATVLMIVSIFALAACQKSGCDVLGHDWGNWTETAATCGENGEKAAE